MTLGLSAAEIAQITAGTLNIGNTSSGAVAVSAAISFSSPVVNVTTGSGNAIAFTGTGSLNPSGGKVTLTTSGRGAITSTTGATDIAAGAGTISLNGGSGGIGASGSPFIVSGMSLDATTLGNGSEFLSAAGAITVDPRGLNAGSGTVELDGGTFTLGGSNRINTSADLNVNRATFAVGVFNQMVETLILTSVSITGSTGVLTSTNTIQAQSGSASAILAGTKGLTKLGTGTVTLSGANRYTGATNIYDGTLAVNGSITSSVTNSGTLQGSGTITGNVSGTGTFSPGNNPTPGIMTINGNFTPSGTLVFKVNSPFATAGTDYDQYSVSGTVKLSGSTLTLTNNIAGTFPALPALLTLINHAPGGGLTIPGSPADGSSVSLGTNTVKLFYNGNTGIDVVIVNGSTPTIAYVSTTFAGDTNGTIIPNVDFSTAGNQPAIYGVNAFTTIGAAIGAITSSGQVIVNASTPTATNPLIVGPYNGTIITPEGTALTNVLLTNVIPGSGNPIPTPEGSAVVTGAEPGTIYGVPSGFLLPGEAGSVFGLSSQGSLFSHPEIPPPAYMGLEHPLPPVVPPDPTLQGATFRTNREITSRLQETEGSYFPVDPKLWRHVYNVPGVSVWARWKRAATSLGPTGNQLPDFRKRREVISLSILSESGGDSLTLFDHLYRKGAARNTAARNTAVRNIAVRNIAASNTAAPDPGPRGPVITEEPTVPGQDDSTLTLTAIWVWAIVAVGLAVVAGVRPTRRWARRVAGGLSHLLFPRTSSENPL